MIDTDTATARRVAGVLAARMSDTATARRVVGVLAVEFGVWPQDVWGRTLKRRIVRVRHWCWWMLVRRHGWSRVRVAEVFGRDDTTVGYGVRRCDRLIRRKEVPAEIADLIGKEVA